MKIILEFILFIVHESLGNDSAFIVLLLNRWLKYALKEQGYNVSDVNLAYEFGKRYQGSLNYIENGVEKQRDFRIIYDGANIQVVDLGTSSLIEEEESEVDEYIREAKNGDAVAQFNLGICYANGDGVNQDYKEASKWFRKAAEQGDADAQYNLGVYYYNGDGVNQDYKEASKWFRKAAEQGHAKAQYNLGVCYSNGYGVNQDYKEASKWYSKAAKQGDADALSSLKKLHSKIKAEEEVYKTTLESLEQGKDAKALVKLGLTHYLGWGVRKNQQVAQKCFKKAAELGSKEAQLIIDGNEEAIALLQKMENSNEID